MKAAGRIRQVLSGHSPVALLHAVTGDGHELKLEVPAAAVAGVAVGDVLVLDWHVFRLDDAVLDDMSTDSAIEPTTGDDAVPDAATVAEATDPEPRSGATVRHLLGLPT